MVEQRMPVNAGAPPSRARRRASARRAWIGAIALLAIVGATAGIAARLPAHADESGLRLDGGGLARLAELAAEAPDDFAGVTIDPATGGVTVRYPSGRGHRSARDRVAAIAAATPAQAQGGTRVGARELARGPDRPVTFVASKYSLRELTAVQDRITADRSWLPDADRILTRWGVDEATNTVTVGLSEITPAGAEAAQRTFGDRVRLVVEQRAHRTSRRNDAAPYSGGNVAFNAADEGCSTAFAVERTDGSRTRGLLTAGHCFTGNGEAVTDFDSRAMGTIASHENVNFGFDRAVITGRSYRPEVFVGPALTSNRRAPIIRAVPIVQGMRMCTSGPVTGEQCSGVVVFVNDCYVFQGGAVTCNVSAVFSQTTRLANFGDSGGPVIMYQDDETDSGPAFAMGVILGGGNDQTGREVLFHETRMAIPPGWRLVPSNI
jgi:hypothetical protein